MQRKADFERLLRQGAQKSVEGYTFYFDWRESGAPRLGLLVSLKHSRRAVERNYLKRCIREAFRQSQESLGALDLLVRPPYGVKGSPGMVLRLRQLFGKLKA